MAAGPSPKPKQMFSGPKSKTPKQMSSAYRAQVRKRELLRDLQSGKRKPTLLASTVVSPIGAISRVAQTVIKSRTSTSGGASKPVSTAAKNKPSSNMAPKQKVGLNPAKYAKRYKDQGQDFASRGQNFRSQVKVNRTPDNTDGPVSRKKTVKGQTAMAARTYGAKSSSKTPANIRATRKY